MSMHENSCCWTLSFRGLQPFTFTHPPKQKQFLALFHQIKNRKILLSLMCFSALVY